MGNEAKVIYYWPYMIWKQPRGRWSDRLIAGCSAVVFQMFDCNSINGNGAT